MQGKKGESGKKKEEEITGKGTLFYFFPDFTKNNGQW